MFPKINVGLGYSFKHVAALMVYATGQPVLRCNLDVARGRHLRQVEDDAFRLTTVAQQRRQQVAVAAADVAVVGEMLHWLIAERERRWQLWWTEWMRGSIGNPLGQQRMWKRMV